jgi:predicted phage terminase large subunit-like protein
MSISNDEELLTQAIREELTAYIQAMNPSWDIPEFHKDICYHLTSRENCIISLPPDHAKSTIATILFATWYWGNNPDKKIIIALGSPKLVSTFAIQIRRQIETPLFQQTFTLRIRPDSDGTTIKHSDQGGSLIIVSKGQGISGLRADLIIFDDIIASATEAMSQKNRDSAWRFITQDLFTRATPNAQKIGIGTRWHDDDVLSRLESNIEFKDYRNIKYKAISDDNKALWPERHNLESLTSIKNLIGSQMFEALFQQNPVPIEGSLFKRKWWQFYEEAPNFTRIIQSWDCAQKVGITNDFTVCTTWGESSNGYYLLDVWRQKVEAPQLEQAAQTMFNKFRPMAVIIEDKSSGSSLIQSLRQKTRIPVIPYDPKQKDKQVRSSAATPLVESGKIYLPLNAPFVEDFIIELERFPFDKHDDQVDSFSQFVEFIRTPSRQLRAAWI